MRNLQYATSEAEALAWAIENIAQYDAKQHALWVAGLQPATQEVVGLRPPNRVYALTTGRRCVIEGYQGSIVVVRLLVPGAPGLAVAIDLLTDVTEQAEDEVLSAAIQAPS